MHHCCHLISLYLELGFVLELEQNCCSVVLLQKYQMYRMSCRERHYSFGQKAVMMVERILNIDLHICKYRTVTGHWTVCYD